MKILFSFLVLSALITFSQKTVATDICAPAPLGSQTDANNTCPNTCIKASGKWTGNWSGKTDNSCGSDNRPGSVCGCVIKVINSTNLCAPDLLLSNDDAKAACPDTCSKEKGKWNGNWVGTSDYKCSGGNSKGSICGCNYTGCSDVILDYERSEENPPNWVATAWYTPCGSNQEAGLAWRATDWTNNLLSIATGTRIRIGQAGKSYSPVDQVVTAPKLHVLCRGSFGRSGSDEDPPCCRDASVPFPCTNVTVEYESGVHWEASISYMPCNKCEQTERTRSGILLTDVFSVTSGTLVQIGPIMTNVSYINENLSGSDVKVRCYGGILGQGTGCCVDGRPNCPPKQTTEPTKGKTPKETPGTKPKETEQKTSGEAKRK